MKEVKLLMLLFLFINYFQLMGQNDKKSKIDTVKIIQLSGVVVSENALEQIPFSTVFDVSTQRGVVTDFYGYFSMVTFPGDTLVFRNSGYVTSSFVVPDTLRENRYSIIHMLQADTVELPMVTIYPWPSRENFAREFLDMEPYSDAYRRAQKQISGESLAFAAARVNDDASLAYGSILNQQYTRIYTNGQMPVNNLLNPYAWSKFIDDWKKGNLKRK
jgi:hypothetical protein